MNHRKFLEDMKRYTDKSTEGTHKSSSGVDYGGWADDGGNVLDFTPEYMYLADFGPNDVIRSGEYKKDDSESSCKDSDRIIWDLN